MSLGLNTPKAQPLPAADELQFQRAVPVSGETASAAASIRRCVACGQIIGDKYFHAQGRIVCPTCAVRIEAGQQAPPAHSLLRAALYGGGAALAGCAIYATVAIVTGYELGLIAILVGYMVGKAVRHASRGGGGRPQQILALCLTYFAITTSYIPVALHAYSTRAHENTVEQQTGAVTVHADEQNTGARERPSLGSALLALLGFALAAPFLSMRSDAMGIISLVIIAIGLRTAWRLTGRPDILITGPYEAVAAS